MVVFDSEGRKRKATLNRCEFCNREYLVPLRFSDQKFCSRTCMSLNKRNRVVVTCAYCGKEAEKPKSKLNNSKSGLFFCSRSCKDAAQHIEVGLTAIHPPHYGTGQHTYRQIAKRNLAWECNRCGYNEVQGVLRVHHKDRNRANNDVTNLEVLCPTCHDVEHYLNNDGLYTNHKRGV